MNTTAATKSAIIHQLPVHQLQENTGGKGSTCSREPGIVLWTLNSGLF